MFSFISLYTYRRIRTILLISGCEWMDKWVFGDNFAWRDSSHRREWASPCDRDGNGPFQSHKVLCRGHGHRIGWDYSHRTLMVVVGTRNTRGSSMLENIYWGIWHIVILPLLFLPWLKKIYQITSRRLIVHVHHLKEIEEIFQRYMYWFNFIY